MSRILLPNIMPRRALSPILQDICADELLKKFMLHLCLCMMWIGVQLAVHWFSLAAKFGMQLF
jgi:hypothetical protein